MLRNTSVATIAAPGFVNLAADALNPGISKADVKVLYLGKNRNGSYIDKETAMKMSETLRACPIVGAYRKDIDDFGDHGEIIHIENGEITFDCATVPYGFVAPDAKVWFKDFTDYDEFGNTVDRTYLMTTAYLWTGQYPEIERCVKEGMGQSMELDGKSIDGHWAEDSETGIEFFIINDASFTKLCVLGNDVEPCFEGASIEAPNISDKFSKENFTTTLYNMMNELKFALAEKQEEVPAKPEEDFFDKSDTTEDADDTFTKEEEKPLDQNTDFNENPVEGEEEPVVEDNIPEDEYTAEKFAEKEEELSNLKEEFTSLQEKYSNLEKEVEELRSFKADRISADKDNLINKYNMLSDDDKAEIVANKDSYSYEEIESKLALLYVKKNVDFEDQEDKQVRQNEPTVTFGVSSENGEAVVDPIIELLRNAVNK